LNDFGQQGGDGGEVGPRLSWSDARGRGKQPRGGALASCELYIRPARERYGWWPPADSWCSAMIIMRGHYLVAMISTFAKKIDERN
jgi:hypothetical protein